ncbi:MAG: MMPL family transporter [Nitrospirae bacterium]|nr:MMPL family transporter [Nitrospirota bacterium]
MLRKHIERIVRFPVTTILLAVFITVFFAFQISGLHMVLDPKALLPQDHPYVKLNNEIEKQFGGSRVVLIGVASKDGDIFNPADIEKIRKITEEVKTLPGILENNVVSIADRKVKVVKAEGDSLEINSLLDGIEYTPEGMKKLKERVYSNPAFINSLISADGTVAAIILDFRGGDSNWQEKQGKAEDNTNNAGRLTKVYDSPVRHPELASGSQTKQGHELLKQFQNNMMDDNGKLSIVSSAYAQEDWKKWQKGGGGKGGEGSAPAGTRPAAEQQGASPPVEDAGQGAGTQQGQEGKWPAAGGGGDAKWPAGGDSGWQAGQGAADWEQWYVSDSKIYSKVLDIVNKYKDANTEIYVGGLPVALSFLEADSLRMSHYIYPVAVVIIMFILYLAFRSIQGMILPIICALLSVVWAVGLMGVFKIPLDPWNMMTPILILAVAAGHSVQILKRYYEELGKYGVAGENPPIPPFEKGGLGGIEGSTHWGRDASKQAVVESLTKIGPVMITAGLVAAASFASLLTFKLKTFQSFGLFTAFGILSALVLEMTFIPAARSLMKPPKKVAGSREHTVEDGGLLDRFLLAISRLVTTRSWLVWIGLIVVAAISLYGINRLTVTNSLKSLFFESTQFRKDDAALNKYFGGTATFYIYLEGQEPDSLKDPAVLHAIENLQKEIESVPEVGKTQSYVDYVKATNQSMHGGDPAYRTIPDSRATISEFLFLFSLSGSNGEMNRFLDYQYQKSVIWVFLRDDSTELGQKLISIVDKYSGGDNGEGFPPGIKVGVAGSIPVMMALNQTMVAGKIWNILQIAGIVFVITSIVLRSPVGGILVLLPLGIAVLTNFGVLGLFGIGLGVGTAAISAMAVGFGADYSIYLIYRLREEVSGRSRQEAGSAGPYDLKVHTDEAIRRTLLTAGKAIIFVALALSAGGLTLLFTGYYLHMEGFLIPVAMITSSLATLIILPAIVKVIRPGFIYK